MNFRPQQEAELAAMVLEAGQRGTQLTIKGGGTRASVGDAVVIETRGLSGITLYEPAEMVISAKAGTPLATIRHKLAQNGQMLPFDPMDYRALLGTSGTPTIGAVAACNNSGSRRVSSGAARDHLIGIRFCSGHGEIIKSGGRVMKNVTGLDLVKLNSGAYGTLGVLTEVTFKVLPKPQKTITLYLRGLDPDAALDAMAQAMATPLEVKSAAHLPSSKRPSMTVLRLEGFAQSCQYRFGRLAEHLKAFGPAAPIVGEAEGELWTSIRDAHPFGAPKFDHVLRVHVPPSRAKSLVELAQTRKLAFMIDWAGGLFWLGVRSGIDIEDIKTQVAQFSGHLIHIRGVTQSRLLPASTDIQVLGQRIKHAFDPSGIFNSDFLRGHL